MLMSSSRGVRGKVQHSRVGPTFRGAPIKSSDESKNFSIEKVLKSFDTYKV